MTTATVTETLTPQEERDLARIIQAGREARRRLEGPGDKGTASKGTPGQGTPGQGTPGQRPDHGEAELVAMVEAAAHARGRFVQANLGLVKYVIRRDAGLVVHDFDDLVQEGVVALLEALDTFDWRRDVRFSTWAVPLIRGRVAEARRLSRGGIRVPVRVARAAAAENVSAVQVASIHAEDGETSWWQAERQEETTVEAEDLRAVMETLSVRHRRVLVLRYGLDGVTAHTQAETAGQLRMAVKTVRRLEHEGLDRMRRGLLTRIQ